MNRIESGGLMYPIGKQFEYDYTNSLAKEKAIKKGQTYRFSVLSDRLIRIEYNPTGKFVDEISQFAINRNFSECVYNTREDDTFLEITTKYFKLSYTKEVNPLGTKIDPMKNLRIELLNVPTEKSWYINHPEVRNFGGNLGSYDVRNNLMNKKGLYSLDGFVSYDDSNSMLIESDGSLKQRETGGLDIYVFLYNTDFKLALNDYYHLTGFPPMIPRYALGNWWSRNEKYHEEELIALVDDFLQNDIPMAVMLLDSDWHIRDSELGLHAKTGYTFNQSLIANPKSVIDHAHSKNMKIALKINPKEGVYPYEVYYSLVAQNLGLTHNKIIIFDPLNPKFLDVFMKVLLHPLENLGIDFFWNDYDEHNESRNQWILNHYMHLDSGRLPAKRNMFLGRPTTLVDHRYPISYSGKTLVSWNTLRELPFRYLNMANSGLSWWSFDVGGNHGGIEEDELYVRYIELGVFSPIFRFHAARGKYYKREPWKWDIRTFNIAKYYLQLRHRLIPYLYTEGYKYHVDGKPLIEPFYYQLPWVYDDNNYKNQYYFGSQLLVAPILNKNDSIMKRNIHKFYIPDGTWYDFKTGKKFPGNNKYVSFFKDEDYPVFAKSGAIVPLADLTDDNQTDSPKEMEIHIFPGVSNTYTLYEDDGKTGLYKEGYFLKTDIDYNYLKNNYTVIIRSIEGKSGIVPQNRTYKLRFRNTKKADEVICYFNQSVLNTESYIEDNDFVVVIKDVQTIGQLTINCKGKDIEIDAVRVIREDIDSILMDLQIDTILKESIANIIFGDLPTNKKRIEIRKLKRKGLIKDYMKLFLKLLEYIDQL